MYVPGRPFNLLAIILEMENSFMVVLLFFTGTLLYVALKVLNWVWFEPKKMEKHLQEHGFKGNPYRLFYGDLKDMKKMVMEARSKPVNGFSHAIEHRVLPLFHDVVQKYGKNTYVWLGPKATVIVMDPESIKEVISNHVVFNKPKSSANYRLVKLLLPGLVSYEGKKWAKHRKIINLAFHQDKLKHMLPAFHTSAMEIVYKWDALLVSQKGSKEVDVWPDLQALTSDVISRTAFGSNYEQGKQIFELQREQAELVVNALQSLYIPGSSLLPTKMNRRMKSISKDVNNSIKIIINERIKAMEAGKVNEDDLLGTLLETNLKEMDINHGNKEVGMSIQDVIEECKLFYFAGQETTSTLLVWTMVLLSKYSHWQNLAREEVLQHFGTKKPDYEGLHHLKIVNMILYEVLRLYPPVFAVSRRSTQEIKLGRVTLPVGVRLSLPIMLLHHDTELWGEDALKFKPERFAEGVSNATKGQVIFFPFGWGPRICIGQNFALLEAKMALALILQRFSFELSPSYTHAPIPIITLQPQHGAHLILHKI